VSNPEYLRPLLSALEDLQVWLHSRSTPFVVIGGVAASLLGRPRLTQDIDLTVIVDPDEWEQLLASGQEHGFEARLSSALDFAKQNRVLLLRHVASGISVDVALGALPFEQQMIRRARPTEVGPLSIPLATPEDLIIMKAIAHRPRDMEDIESVLSIHPDLDRRRVLRWIREFASVLERPELLTDVQVMLRRQQRGRT
jgi:predicted nucleotidyltransferase